MILAAVTVLSGFAVALPRPPEDAGPQKLAAAPPTATPAAHVTNTPAPRPSAPPVSSPAPIATPTAAPTPTPTPFRPNAIRKVSKEVIAGLNFNGNLEPYTLVLRGPKSLDMKDLEYIGFIQYDVRLSATARRGDDCEFTAWQEDQDFDYTTGKGTWVDEARWTLAPEAGTTKTAHEPKLIALGLERRLHVRTDCKDWTIKIRGVDLGHGKVPGAPKWWTACRIWTARTSGQRLAPTSSSTTSVRRARCCTASTGMVMARHASGGSSSLHPVGLV